MNPMLQSIQLHTQSARSAQTAVDIAKARLSEAKRHLMHDWIEVRKVLNAILPADSHMMLGLTQSNTWEEEFVYSADDVVAYVQLCRYFGQWNYQLNPIAAIELNKDEWKLAMQIEEKISELGFTMVHDVVTDGNVTVWRLSMPTQCSIVLSSTHPRLP